MLMVQQVVIAADFVDLAADLVYLVQQLYLYRPLFFSFTTSSTRFQDSDDVPEQEDDTDIHTAISHSNAIAIIDRWQR
jgi:hypothetical protein